VRVELQASAGRLRRPLSLSVRRKEDSGSRDLAVVRPRGDEPSRHGEVPVSKPRLCPDCSGILLYEAETARCTYGCKRAWSIRELQAHDRASSGGSSDMALAPCRECGRDVSSEAVSCPHCGVPSPARPTSTVVKPAGVPPASQARLGGCGVVLLIFVGLMVLGSLLGNQSGKSTSPSPSSSARPFYSGSREVASGADPGDQLAAIEEQTTFPSEVTRARFRTLLARLAPRCHESEVRVSDMIVKTQQMLKEKGISVRLIEIAEELDRSVEVLRGSDAPDTCPKVLALYSILRESQGVTGR
jgi:hypothetical protein